MVEMISAYTQVIRSERQLCSGSETSFRRDMETTVCGTPASVSMGQRSRPTIVFHDWCSRITANIMISKQLAVASKESRRAKLTFMPPVLSLSYRQPDLSTARAVADFVVDVYSQYGCSR